MFFDCRVQPPGEADVVRLPASVGRRSRLSNSIEAMLITSFRLRVMIPPHGSRRNAVDDYHFLTLEIHDTNRNHHHGHGLDEVFGQLALSSIANWQITIYKARLGRATGRC